MNNKYLNFLICSFTGEVTLYRCIGVAHGGDLQYQLKISSPFVYRPQNLEFFYYDHNKVGRHLTRMSKQNSCKALIFKTTRKVYAQILRVQFICVEFHYILKTFYTLLSYTKYLCTISPKVVNWIHILNYR